MRKMRIQTSLKTKSIKDTQPLPKVLPLPKSTSTSAIDAEGEESTADTKSSSNLNVEHTN